MRAALYEFECGACGEYVHLSEGRARSYGWTFANGIDRCPDCAKKEPTPREPAPPAAPTDDVEKMAWSLASVFYYRPPDNLSGNWHKVAAHVLKLVDEAKWEMFQLCADYRDRMKAMEQQHAAALVQAKREALEDVCRKFKSMLWQGSAQVVDDHIAQLDSPNAEPKP